MDRIDEKEDLQAKHRHENRVGKYVKKWLEEIWLQTHHQPLDRREKWRRIAWRQQKLYSAVAEPTEVLTYNRKTETVFGKVLQPRAESVTENRNRYRDILKNRKRHRRRYWKNRKPTEKIPEKKRKFGFCWWRFTNLKYIYFLPLTLRNEDVKLHYPPVLSLLLCTVLENCRNISSTSRNYN